MTQLLVGIGICVFAVALSAEQATERPFNAALSIERSPTMAEKEMLDRARTEDLQLYMQRVKDFQDTVSHSVNRAYTLRRKFIEEKYQNKIKEEEQQEEKALKDAIAYFERFLKKYPEDPPYTPDAMFRLAELYYDVSYIDYINRLDAYNAALDAGQAGDIAFPEKSFARSISLFEQLVERYPEYENVDGAYYLLGYCLKEMGRDEEARLAWLNLVCPNKFQYDPARFATDKAATELGAENPSATLQTASDDNWDEGEGAGAFVDPYADCRPVVRDSRFFFESWWLVGNYHFDYDSSRYGVETAISAYEKLTTDEDHKFYDKGLYKLAWSYYKADMYPEAIDTFAKVVEYSDKRGMSDSSMRPEAIQYLAVCFFTDDWDGDMMPDEVSGIQRVQNPAYLNQDSPWVREVYARLGDIYSDNEKHEEAITIWNLYVEKWPLDSEAPFIQDKIANSYRTQRRFEEELEARSKLEMYGEDSEWWTANDAYPEKQAQVARMAQNALINAALTHHENAQTLRARARATQDEEIMAFALEEYALASAAYRKYLEQNPDSPDAYDLNYQLADALFWSGNPSEAKGEYIKVRDSNLDDKYRSDAAKMVILCLEQMMETQVSDGAIVLRDEPPEVPEGERVPESIPMPPLLLELMAEREEYLKRETESKDAATFNYQSAQNYYRYGYWDEAQQRYMAIYEEYCQKDEIAIFSWKTMLNMAVEQNDLDRREALALMEQEKQCGEGLDVPDDEAIALDTVLGDVAMQRAMALFKTCSTDEDIDVCTEAGEKLVAAVERAPDHPSADAALHNGALAYEKAQRNKTAMDLYGRIVEEYPESQWVDKCIFKQAYSANAFFEYEKALGAYKILADERRFSDSEYRDDAILNTALILTNLQDYQKASAYWKNYAAVAEDDAAKIEAEFNAADVYFRAAAYKTAIDEYERFIRKYRGSPDSGPYVMKAVYRVGRSYGLRNQSRLEIKNSDRVIAFYRDYYPEPGSMGAEYAAESHFKQIERDLEKFENYRISGTLKVINQKITEGLEQVKSFEDRYRDIQAYRRPVWSLAAEFRIGFVYEVMAKAILNIPPPPLDKELQKQLKLLPKEDRDLVMMEYEDKFRMAMEDKVRNMEEKAKSEYRLAIELARKGNISNDWALWALERMNAYAPEEYPRQINGLTTIESDIVSVPPWAPEVTE